MTKISDTQNTDIALVTGASSGLGMEYCRQLAARCKKIILVARREQSMRELAEELRASGVEAEIVVADLNSTIGVSRVIETIRQKGPVTYLVNNADFTTLGDFADNQVEGQQDMVNLHCNTSLSLCRAVIPYMVEQGRGWIINLSSIASFIPTQGLAVYAASKAFLNTFSEALQAELEPHNIKVQSFCPGYTRTGFHSTEEFTGFDPNSIPEELWANAEDTVAASLSALSSEQTVIVHGEKNFELSLAMRSKSTAAIGCES